MASGSAAVPATPASNSSPCLAVSPLCSRSFRLLPSARCKLPASFCPPILRLSGSPVPASCQLPAARWAPVPDSPGGLFDGQSPFPVEGGLAGASADSRRRIGFFPPRAASSAIRLIRRPRTFGNLSWLATSRITDY